MFDKSKDRHWIHSSDNHNVLLGGLVGGLIGAAAALLLAPKAGSELIEDIIRTFSGNSSQPSTPSSSDSLPRTRKNKTKRIGRKVEVRDFLEQGKAIKKKNSKVLSSKKKSLPNSSVAVDPIEEREAEREKEE